MPELPEVETIRRDLLPRVVGRTITHVYLSPDAPRLVRWPSPAEFCRALPGQRIEAISRRGKYLLFHLSDGPACRQARRYLIVHLRMTGVLLHRDQDAPADAYLRAVLALDHGDELRYTDFRKLGTMWLTDDPHSVVGRLGPDVLDQAFTVAVLRSLLDRRSAPIKAVLMDQGALAGLGNIYSEEALFLAGVHPQRPAKSLSDDDVTRLHRAIGEVLAEALGHRGSSFRDYVDAEGRQGRHQWHVKVYRRTDEPCYTCGTQIERVKVGGRSTHFCPRCQK
ncbi:MAG: bifunctional DNA-formamidopyrimidine glycosylase/DNA-(apurinic or apyrimidinic site) lyase [Chloroflexota bacterium]|nr:bifunctional DNA-formamidopyrimidine glycosylase/DNA-(apurinic or apyrimidinic site) lyase [Chloroflexota bacterium]